MCRFLKHSLLVLLFSVVWTTSVTISLEEPVSSTESSLSTRKTTKSVSDESTTDLGSVRTSTTPSANTVSGISAVTSTVAENDIATIGLTETITVYISTTADSDTSIQLTTATFVSPSYTGSSSSSPVSIKTTEGISDSPFSPNITGESTTQAVSTLDGTNYTSTLDTHSTDYNTSVTRILTTPYSNSSTVPNITHTTPISNTSNGSEMTTNSSTSYGTESTQTSTIISTGTSQTATKGNTEASPLPTRNKTTEGTMTTNSTNDLSGEAKESGNNAGVILGAIIGSILGVCLVCLVVFFLCGAKKPETFSHRRLYEDIRNEPVLRLDGEVSPYDVSYGDSSYYNPTALEEYTNRPNETIAMDDIRPYHP